MLIKLNLFYYLELLLKLEINWRSSFNLHFTFIYKLIYVPVLSNSGFLTKVK